MYDLEEALKILSENHAASEPASLYDRYKATKSYLESEYYDWVGDRLPYYTDHGKKHIDSVIDQAGMLLQDELENPVEGELDVLDVYILLSSIIWHDVGMVKGRADHEDKLVEVSEEVRDIAFPEPGVRGLIDKCVKGHTGDKALSIPPTNNPYTIGAKSFEPDGRALSAILRFADELSESEARVSNADDVFDQVSDDQKIFWAYAKSIKGIIPRPNKERVIVNIEVSEEEASREYIVPDKFASRTDREPDPEVGLKLPLIEYVVFRLEKMNNERAYCTAEFRPYVTMRDIDVRITITDEDLSPVTDISEILGGAGLTAENSIREIPIYEEFFDKYHSWKAGDFAKTTA